MELCVTSLHNYKFEDWGFIIRVLMFSKGSVRLMLPHDNGVRFEILQKKKLFIKLYLTLKMSVLKLKLSVLRISFPKSYI